jgi:hypothetical protein
MPYADLARPEPSADRWRIALGLREAFAARATNCRRCRRMWGRQYSRPAPAIGGGAYSGTSRTHRRGAGPSGKGRDRRCMPPAYCIETGPSYVTAPASG